MRNRRLILLLALTAVILYDAVLPLWEGWDEPFHFGYVQALQYWNELPVVGKTTISKEVETSFFLTPLPKFLSDAVPGSTSFAQQPELAFDARARLRDQLLRIPIGLQREKSAFPNYEAQQAPLAYLLLIPFDAALGRLPLIRRVFWLRIFGSVAGMLLTFFAVERLLTIFAIERRLQNVALACILNAQVLWASMAHVGNDWLAIPLTIWFIVFLARAATASDQTDKPSSRARKQTVLALFHQPATLRNLFAAALILGLGLLTKAYFLPFVPVLGALYLYQALVGRVKRSPAAYAFLLTLLIGGTWYLRNLVLYHTLAGTQESIRGIPPIEVFRALTSINWLKSSLALFRSSLWCGNWSFTPFPKGPLNVEMAFLLVGLVLYAAHPQPRGVGLRWVALSCGIFSAALVYQTCSAWVDSHGALTTTEPWYIQGVLPVVWAAVFAGLKGRRWLGFLFASSLSCLTAGIAAVTYLRFLIPGYASGIQRPTTSEAWAWWTAHPTADLMLVSLAPPAFVYTLLTIYLAILLIVTVSTLSAITPRSPAWSDGSNRL